MVVYVIVLWDKCTEYQISTLADESLETNKYWYQTMDGIADLRHQSLDADG